MLKAVPIRLAEWFHLKEHTMKAWLHTRQHWVLFVLLLALAACSGGGGGGQGGSAQGAAAAPGTTRAIYDQNGGVGKPDNAIEVYIVYAPESQTYMPEIIRQFNQAYANGTNPLTGQSLAQGERPVYVWGTDPVDGGSSGTVAQDIINTLSVSNYDAVYRPTIFAPSVSHWLSIVNYETSQQVFDVFASSGTALTPVIIAGWESRVNAIRQTLGVDSLGWDDLLAVLNSPNGWCDFGVENCRRAVYYGQADPNHSSTGLSATIEQYYACARSTGVLDATERLDRNTVLNSTVQSCVYGIQQLVRHYSRRTEDFLEYIGQGPEFLDFVMLEETDLICINTGGRQGDEQCTRPQEPLVAIYPEEGTFWHEHPFGILNTSWVSPEQRAAAQVFTDFVLTSGPQTLIMQQGFRPANPDVQLGYPFTPENGITLEGPPTILDIPETDALIAIQENWGQIKRQADVILLVDVSGSMAGERIDNAREGIITLLESLPNSTRIGLVSFSDRVTIWDPLDNFENNQALVRYHVNCDGPRDSRFPAFRFASCLEPGGSTSLYTALRVTVDIADATSNPERMRIVILLSDGQDTCEAEGCATLEDVVTKIERTRQSVNPIIIFPIAYGITSDDPAMRALRTIADTSRTQVILGDTGEIAAILQLLSGYF